MGEVPLYLKYQTSIRNLLTTCDEGAIYDLISQPSTLKPKPWALKPIQN
jgi:hypothetical protein